MRLQAQQLEKVYKSRRVVDGVDLYIDKGEIVGLLGTNGAGKTTTFYMMVGFVRPGRGKVMLDNHDLTHLPMYRRARLGLGYLAQESSVFRKLSVEDNLKLVLELRVRSRKRRREIIEKLLEEFNLLHLRNHRGDTLSGGERRRLEIARALSVEPHFLLLDEPFTGVDPKSIEDIQEIIHDYLMEKGTIIESGTPREIADSEIAREKYLGKRFKLEEVDLPEVFRKDKKKEEPPPKKKKKKVRPSDLDLKDLSKTLDDIQEKLEETDG
jgi:lipopolysaccharide export system ATP-binding protein